MPPRTVIILGVCLLALLGIVAPSVRGYSAASLSVASSSSRFSLTANREQCRVTRSTLFFLSPLPSTPSDSVASDGLIVQDGPDADSQDESVLPDVEVEALRRQSRWWQRWLSRGTFGMIKKLGSNKRHIVSKKGHSGPNTKLGSLILLRCGESVSNSRQIFTGWDDPDLTAKGIDQCQRAGQLLVMHGLDSLVDVVYASMLKRSIKSAFVVLQTTGSAFVTVQKRWRLNQRHYGAAQGLSKRDAAQRLGEAVVASWRTTLKAKPPPLSRLDPSHPVHDRRYRDVPNATAVLPSSESLLDCQKRATVVWEEEILGLVSEGKTVLVVGHRDTLLGIVRALDGIDESKLASVRIPRGVPILYRFEPVAEERSDPDKGKPRLVPKPVTPPQHLSKQAAVQRVNHASAVYLEQPEKLHVELQRDLEWTNLRFAAAAAFAIHGVNDEVPSQLGGGGDAHFLPLARRDQTLVSRVQRLRIESNLLAPNLAPKDASNEGAPKYSSGAAHSSNDSPQAAGAAEPAAASSSSLSSQGSDRWTDDPSEFEDYDEFNDFDAIGDVTAQDLTTTEMPSEESSTNAFISTDDSAQVKPVVLPLPDIASSSSWPHDHAYIVLIRHGRTPHNNLGLFTGWEDPPLAPDGVEDAKKAGRLLRRHGFEFDVVYTSWLTRAIQTAFYVMDELDSTWLPLVKSWRLNERMYGALTGKSKRQIEAEYGEDQLKTWRRGYTVRPPPISVYSPNSPGNDLRRAKHFDDLPLSIKESFFRSLEARKLVVHRKFPRTESLKCCMDRTLPFYRDRIRVDAVNRGRRVLIASHENAIRGILMHLCDIPESAMSQLHLPNGLPLVYNVKGKCIALLEGEEDESEGAELHDFGPAAQYLFRTCKIDDDFYERMQQQV